MNRNQFLYPVIHNALSWHYMFTEYTGKPFPNFKEFSALFGCNSIAVPLLGATHIILRFDKK